MWKDWTVKKGKKPVKHPEWAVCWWGPSPSAGLLWAHWRAEASRTGKRRADHGASRPPHWISLPTGPEHTLMGWRGQQRHVSKVFQWGFIETKSRSLEFGILNGIKARPQSCYLWFDVPKVMRQWQHCKEEVNRSSPQVCWVYIHLEFGQFPDKRKANIQNL